MSDAYRPGPEPLATKPPSRDEETLSALAQEVMTRFAWIAARLERMSNDEHNGLRDVTGKLRVRLDEAVHKCRRLLP